MTSPECRILTAMVLERRQIKYRIEQIVKEPRDHSRGMWAKALVEEVVRALLIEQRRMDEPTTEALT